MKYVKAATLEKNTEISKQEKAFVLHLTSVNNR